MNLDVLRNHIEELSPWLATTRRHLHKHPELSRDEQETSAYVAQSLNGLPLRVTTGVGGYGVVAELTGDGEGPTVALRGDMDALPILEKTGLEYASCKEGVMHACGHDGHTTVLLGAARILSSMRPHIRGKVRFVFQPSEETVGGARRMINEGALDGVDRIYALHGWPGIDVGRIGVRSGPIMASADTFDIDVLGKGAHAAYPHFSVDPIVVGAALVTALQSLISRERDPLDPVVLSVTQFHAGTAYNVIAGNAVLKGTYRTLQPSTREGLPSKIRRVAEGICSGFGATACCTFTEGTAVTNNDFRAVDDMRRVAIEAWGSNSIVELDRPTMGAEDFGEMTAHTSGAMFRLGLGNVTPLHTPTFDFTDAALPIGVEMFCRLALTCANHI